MPEYKIEMIAAEKTIDLRMRVLRPFHPREACEYAEDSLPTTFHVGVLQDNKVIGNGTFMQQAQPQLPGSKLAYRLRGMATEPALQSKGLGRKIIETAEIELAKRGCDLLWFNARVSAEGFYKKLGYVAIEEVFEIDTVGPHKIMYKWFVR